MPYLSTDDVPNKPAITWAQPGTASRAADGAPWSPDQTRAWAWSYEPSARDVGDVVACAAGPEHHTRRPTKGHDGDQGEQVLRQQAAHLRACAVVGRLGGDNEDVFVFRRQRRDVAHFGVSINGTRYFAKALLDPDDAAAQYKLDTERQWATWAAHEGFAPQVLQEPSLPDVLLTRWLPRAVMKSADVEDLTTKATLLARVREIHTRLPPRPALQPPAPVGSSWGFVQNMLVAGAEPLDPGDLYQRLSWIDDQLRQSNIQHRVAHGDIALGNTIFYEGEYYFVDWENAGWGDAYRDPARLVSSGHWDNAQLDRWLQLYLGRPATPLELRHMALLVAAFDIDHYGNHRCRAKPDGDSVALYASRITVGFTALEDMPPVRSIGR